SFAVFGVTTVLPVFVKHLTDDNVWVALISNLEMAGWHLPQLFSAAFILHLMYKMPVYRVLAVVRVVTIGAIIILVVFIPPGPVLLLSFVAAYALYSLAGGLAGAPFMDVIGKIVPMENRGVLFAIRRLVGGTLALLTAYFIIEPVLGTFAFPYSYAAVFIVGLIAVSIGLGAMSVTREPPGRPPTRHFSFANTVRLGFAALVNERSFRNFYFARAAIAVNRAAMPFYIGLALTVLELPDSAAGLFLGVQTVGFISSNAIWGILSRRWGSKTLLVLGATASFIPPALALSAGLAGYYAPWVYYSVFFALGLSLTGFDLGSISYLIDLSPEDRRPVYVGTMNTLSGFFLVIGLAGGYILNRFNYETLFALSAAGAATAAIIAVKLHDPFRELAKRRTTISRG
ncbi:MAG: MFS transporter, partial [Candidatus Coatesbacteria bacterium]